MRKPGGETRIGLERVTLNALLGPPPLLHSDRATMVELSAQENANNLAQTLNGLSVAQPDGSSQASGTTSGAARQLQEAAVNSDLASIDSAALWELVFESMTLEDKIHVVGLARARGLLHDARAQNSNVLGSHAGITHPYPPISAQMQQYRQAMQAVHLRGTLAQQPSSGRGPGPADAMRQLQEAAVNADLLRVEPLDLLALKTELGLAHKDLQSMTLDEKQRVGGLARARGYLPPNHPGMATRAPSVPTQASPPHMQPQDGFGADLMGGNFDTFGFDPDFGQSDSFYGLGDLGDMSEWYNDQGLVANNV
ncbi:hypothetical protein PsYK624_100220 [Phanerochaete sordida]|uniref:Uncharacterized protein n=1 Tax=Phanerochaete sordida TaxID=48140 RepID=A0A9P3GD13_9APHY|nr:hypothetical protein PsYK624_100220 [Phanerochaete sordida]